MVPVDAPPVVALAVLEAAAAPWPHPAASTPINASNSSPSDVPLKGPRLSRRPSDYMCLMIASPKPEHDSSVTLWPSAFMSRAKS